jgi:hypothetical protein
VPLPEPVDPESIVMNWLSLAADQLHPAVVVTFTLPVPPPAPNEALGGLNEKLQGAWVTVNSLPFTLILV